MDHKDILLRLNKIEGQVRGIYRMVEQKRYCIDILHQITAIRAATNQVGLALLENHMQGCVRAAMENGEVNEQIDELILVMKQFVKNS